MTPRQRTLRRWPTARCVKHFDVDLFCIYTVPKGRGVSVPRSSWRSTRWLAWVEASDAAKPRSPSTTAKGKS